MPIEEMTKDIQLPVAFLRFIGVAEIVGAIGLIVPSLLRIRPGLTPLAAGGSVIMIGATMLSLMIGGVVMALMPFVVGAPRGVRGLRPWKLTPSPARPRAHTTFARLSEPSCSRSSSRSPRSWC